MKKRISKKLVITTGVLAVMLFAPAAPKSTIGQAISTVINQIEVQAAQTYSDNWKEDAMGNWHFYNDDGTLVTNSWVHDYGEWYLLDSNGTMRTGVFRSNGGKCYILDTVRGTGTYGKLLKDGMVYQGVVLHADTSATYEGALSDETLQELANVGVDTVNVPNVENTLHVDKDAERAGHVDAGNTQLISNEGTEGEYYDSIAEAESMLRARILRMVEEMQSLGIHDFDYLTADVLEGYSEEQLLDLGKLFVPYVLEHESLHKK